LWTVIEQLVKFVAELMSEKEGPGLDAAKRDLCPIAYTLRDHHYPS